MHRYNSNIMPQLRQILLELFLNLISNILYYKTVKVIFTCCKYTHIVKSYSQNQFKDKDNNVILTQTEGLTMGKPSSPKYARNKNILVIGGSGSGKTRFFVKPNLMQMHSSYIVTDPKGTVLIECGKMLERGKSYKDDKGNLSYQPYRIKVFNTIDFGKSMHYNPFAYFSKKNREKDILKFVDVLIMFLSIILDTFYSRRM